MEDIYCSFNDSADTIKKKNHFNFDCWPKNTCFKKLKGKTKIMKKNSTGGWTRVESCMFMFTL